MLEVFTALIPMWQANPLPKWSRLPDRDFGFEPEIGEINVVLFINLKKMADNVTEAPFLEKIGEAERKCGTLAFEIVQEGLLSQGSGCFRERWVRSLLGLERARNNPEAMKKAAESMAQLQAELSCYLYLTTLAGNSDLEARVGNVILGRGSLIDCGRGITPDRAANSLVGPISVLTLYYLLVEANPNLKRRLPLHTLFSAGAYYDVAYKIDLVLDPGIVVDEGKRCRWVVQLKTGKEDDVLVEEVVSGVGLGWWYAGGKFSQVDAERMIMGARKLYPRDAIRFRAVLVPGFEPSNPNNSLVDVFGRIKDKSRHILLASNLAKQLRRCGDDVLLSW
jgi:hypothetical protein